MPSGVSELASEQLSGYVLKKDSPSCGLERVKVYGAHNVPSKSGRGLFASRLVERFPDLPVKEEGRLSDPRLRENFVERVFAYGGSALFSGQMEPRRTGPVSHGAQADPDGAFAEGVSAARASGGTCADAADESEQRYRRAFMAALAVIATPRRHTNVLQHMAGYFKEQLDRESKAELLAAIDDYRRSSCR